MDNAIAPAISESELERLPVLEVALGAFPLAILAYH